ncbi:MAG: hypothetical protein IPK03_17390 [Bacteroidetes bacterium]|nr:hypothetical protein [Bacteroidota bacterium]
MKENWEQLFKDQHETCNRIGSDWVLADLELKIGIADNVLTDLNPINRLRSPIENGTTGWYIWSGQRFSDDADFFKPYCIKHLIELKPSIIKYLGLPPGFRFLIDKRI